MQSKVWLVTAALTVALPVTSDEAIQPWEVWKDLATVATVDANVRTVVVSSADPNGGPYDRHSEGDSRFIRVVNDEGVIFETEGAGAITRIWMTQGDGTSTDLDPAIRLRIRIDGVDDPVVDLSLQDFFGGSAAPFLSPMVLNRRHSGGGNVSLVPIPFQNGCSVTLVNADTAKIWFQVSAMVVDQPDGIVSFTGDEDLAEWRRMVSRPGSDPWLVPRQAATLDQETVSGTVVLEPGEPVDLAAFTGPDEITAIVLRVPEWRLSEVVIRIFFDGRKTVDLRLPWLFGVGHRRCSAIRSLFVGIDQGDAYSYFPMPFRRKAKIVVELSSQSPSPLTMDFAVRRAGSKPDPRAGIFTAEVIDIPASTPGKRAMLLDLPGPGRLAGLFVTGRSVDDGGWTFLEGDEWLTIDGEADAFWKGTGVEDFFGGGFYFKNPEGKTTTFSQALHGMTCVSVFEDRPVISAFRLFPTEGPSFEHSLQLELEGGANGEEAVRWRGVAWYYGLPN